MWTKTQCSICPKPKSVLNYRGADCNGRLISLTETKEEDSKWASALLNGISAGISAQAQRVWRLLTNQEPQTQQSLIWHLVLTQSSYHKWEGMTGCDIFFLFCCHFVMYALQSVLHTFFLLTNVKTNSTVTSTGDGLVPPLYGAVKPVRQYKPGELQSLKAEAPYPMPPASK